MNTQRAPYQPLHLRVSPLNHQRPERVQICVICNVEFRTALANHKTCSKPCQRKRHSKMAAQFGGTNRKEKRLATASLKVPVRRK